MSLGPKYLYAGDENVGSFCIRFATGSDTSSERFNIAMF